MLIPCGKYRCEYGIVFHITFNNISKERALEYLKNNNNFFKLSSYRKNFPKRNGTDKYINLDFSHLADLAVIDTRLRGLFLCALFDTLLARKAILPSASLNTMPWRLLFIKKWPSRQLFRRLEGHFALKNSHEPYFYLPVLPRTGTANIHLNLRICYTSIIHYMQHIVHLYCFITCQSLN